jgi:hypothetical protein
MRRQGDKSIGEACGQARPGALKKLNKAIEQAKAGYNTELAAAAAAARKQRAKDLGAEHVDNDVNVDADVDELDDPELKNPED